MKTADVLSLARESLRLHRLRTGLTVLAVAIGVTAVLLLTSLGEATKAYVTHQFVGVGTNLVVILPGRTETFGVGAGITTGIRDVTLDDCEAIRHRCSAVVDVAPVSLGSAAIEYGGRHRDVRVLGTTDAYARVRVLHAAAGQLLPPGDPRRGDQVAVIGSTVRRELFGAENPLGKSVRIARARFTVIGVLEPRGQSLGFDFDELALVPVGVGLRMFNQSGLFRVMAQAASAEDIPAAIRQVRAVLTERHKDEDFTLITQDAMLKSFRSVIDAMTLALAGIAAISLAVAGIGIMNVMLVAVSERTAEVGLLKALGADRGQILSLFLTEAIMLSGMGALAGLALGLALMQVGGVLFPALTLQPSVIWIAAVVALSLGAGALFGLSPARRAASLASVEALRGRR
ncbi:MAG TPA: ABC transporter permease [Candidatus Saccharimonadales bacterium]|nr:ABC transporter permease [Candidatus Saccharimonadales bacterium]